MMPAQIITAIRDKIVLERSIQEAM